MAVNHDENKKLVNSYNQKIEQNEQILSEIQLFKSSITDLYATEFERELEKIMKEIDIEVLVNEKRRLNINLLQENGITNVWELYNSSFENLCDINGIGDKSSEILLEIANHYVEKVKQSINVKLDVNTSSIEIIKVIYLCKEFDKVSLDIEKISKNSEKIKLALKDVVCNKLKWIFISKSKKQKTFETIELLQSAEKLDYLQNSLIEDTYNKCIIKENAIKDFKENSISYYIFLEKNCNIELKDEDSKAGISNEVIEKVEQYTLDASFMKSELRGYQEFGTKYILTQENVLVGDEMGLGKTIQALSAIADLYARGNLYSLVVCPLSLLENWINETKKHTNIPITKIHKKPVSEFDIWTQKKGIAVTTYETLKHIDLTEKVSILVVDEAHYIKNPSAQRTKELQRIASFIDRKVFMTGTPIENDVDEMSFLIKNLNHEIYEIISDIKFLVNTDNFKEAISPVYLRRKREDVLKELPELIEIDEWIELTKKEMSEHIENLYSKDLMNLRRVSWENDDITKSSKAERLKEICDEAKIENRKVIVFSYFKDTINKVCTLLGERCAEPLTGEVSGDMRQKLVDDFAKSEICDVLVAQVVVGGVGLNIQCASVVIFCEPQWKPSTEVQALSRAYRMGQLQTVTVHRILARNSIDERVLSVKHGKEIIFDDYADESVINDKFLDMKAIDELIGTI
ncbi:MAG: DEAD/DEAH box helicase [Clostridia bacterium]